MVPRCTCTPTLTFTHLPLTRRVGCLVVTQCRLALHACINGNGAYYLSKDTMISSWSVTTNYDAYIIGEMANSKNRRNNGNNHRRSMQRRCSGLKYREKMARKQSSHQRHGDESLHGSRIINLDKLQEFIDQLTVCSLFPEVLNAPLMSSFVPRLPQDWPPTEKYLWGHALCAMS